MNQKILYICTMKGSLFPHLILIQYLLSAASALSAATGHVWGQSWRNNRYCDHLNHWDSCVAVNISLPLDISTHCTLSHQILINSLCLTSNYPHTIWYCNYFVAIKYLSRLKLIRLKKKVLEGQRKYETSMYCSHDELFRISHLIYLLLLMLRLREVNYLEFARILFLILSKQKAGNK